MQCFTYGNKYPRTVLWSTYRPPPPESYKKRPHFLPDPTKIGRPFCPDVKPYPKNIVDASYLQYNPPLEAPHRERKMDEMLAHINKVNWSCGQDAKRLGRRRSVLSESLHYSLQSTYRSQFTGHNVDKPPLIRPTTHYSVGITPCLTPRTYVAPEQHPYTVGVYYRDLAQRTGEEVRCGKVTVPLEIPAPYPGPMPKVPHVSSTGDEIRTKVKVMGIVL